MWLLHQKIWIESLVFMVRRREKMGGEAFNLLINGCRCRCKPVSKASIQLPVEAGKIITASEINLT